MNKLIASLKFRENFGLIFIWLVFMGFYISGLIFPDTWWSTHFIAFIPPLWKWILLISAILIPVVLFIAKHYGWKFKDQSTEKNKRSHMVILGVTIIMGILFLQFPIAHDNYGEAYLLQKYLDKTADEIPVQAMDEFFSFSLSPWAGQNTIMSLVTFISYFGQVNYQWAFVVLDLIFGLLFVISWLYFISSYLHDRKWKIIMALAGLSAPFMLNFFGHIEINAPSLFCNLLWSILLLSYLRKGKTYQLWGLLVLLLVCIKFHAVALLFVPALVLVFFRHYFTDFVQKKKLVSWRKTVVFLLVPIFVTSALAYFFIFKDHNDPRQLQDTAMEFDRVFLPLVSPDPPLDKYNMLSLNHIFDYFSEMLLWSPVVLFLIVCIALFYRKKIDWNHPAVVLTGLTLLLFGSLFFVVNPLLSMQMDWDLFAMPAPVFLVFGVVLISQIQKVKVNEMLVAGSFSLVLMSIPFFIVHASTNPLSHRLESAGIRIYKTYYEWSNQTIQFALNIADEDISTVRARKRNVLKKLEPYAMPDKDYEFARLLASEGEQVLRDDRNYKKALEIFEKVSYYYPDEENNILYKLEAHFLLNQMKEAYEYSLQLIELKHPDEQKALRIAIHTALEAEYYDKAMVHAGDYINKWGSEDVLGEVYYRLQNGIEVEELKFLFTRGN